MCESNQTILDMAHVQIFGQTLSGKTCLAQTILVPAYRRAGIHSIVFDPLDDPKWHADFKTADLDEFMRVVWESRQCAIFIDEAGESAGRYDNEMIKVATRGRHWGHKAHFLSQRGVQIATTIRDQCTGMFLFTTSASDCKIHANEWNDEQLRTGNTLKQGEFFFVTRFQRATRHQLFGDK